MQSHRLKKKMELKDRHKKVREKRRQLRDEYQQLKRISRSNSFTLRNYERTK